MTEDVKKSIVEISEINVQIIKLQKRISNVADKLFKLGLKRNYKFDVASEKLEDALEGLSALYFELKDKE